jgi:branched-chain amino acid transport system permease protein
VVTRILIFAMVAASLNFILGYGGMVSFGHAVFFGLGAYVTAIASFHGVTSAWLIWLLAALVTALVGLVIGVIALHAGGVFHHDHHGAGAIVLLLFRRLPVLRR